MGWWNVKARDLKFGDEVRGLGFPDAGPLPKVHDVDTGGASGRVAVLLEWPDSGATDWEDFAPDEQLTVRR